MDKLLEKECGGGLVGKFGVARELSAVNLSGELDKGKGVQHASHQVTYYHPHPI